MNAAVHLLETPSTPWKNGLGRTRELLAWPDAASWWLRVSVAEIEVDAPFSSFQNVDRCIVVLQGAGIELALPRGSVKLTPEDDAACAFAGEDAPDCRLLRGPTRDLNLMVRRGMGRPVIQRTPLGPKHGPWRGVYSQGVLHWTVDAGSKLPAAAGAWYLGMTQP